jgi:hypothetical protein
MCPHLLQLRYSVVDIGDLLAQKRKLLFSGPAPGRLWIGERFEFR